FFRKNKPGERIFRRHSLSEIDLSFGQALGKALVQSLSGAKSLSVLGIADGRSRRLNRGIVRSAFRGSER
ncbi:hypothetical protein, partial [Mesorhizobium sp. LSJC280B00]|uniref:hypothetical protein n=1 Tax=Mesorhizobium sp. LSJC280B00 TaxID=1287336 RepID=UPI001AEC0055